VNAVSASPKRVVNPLITRERLVMNSGIIWTIVGILLIVALLIYIL
jgi:hypothetical protein